MADERYRVRRATAADAPALEAVEKAAFDARAYGGMIMTAPLYRRHAANANILLVVEEIANPGVAVGYALGFVKKSSPYVRFYSLAVLPEHQGGGGGSLLFKGMEEAARAGGYRGMRLEVRSDNARLRERYARYGYTPFVEAPDYYPDGCSAIRMIKDFA